MIPRNQRGWPTWPIFLFDPLQIFIYKIKLMTKYEVRVTQTHVDYYRIDAKDQKQAKALIRQHIIEGDTFIEAKKVDTILRPSEIDYAVKIDNKGEVIYQ